MIAHISLARLGIANQIAETTRSIIPQALHSVLGPQGPLLVSDTDELTQNKRKKFLSQQKRSLDVPGVSLTPHCEQTNFPIRTRYGFCRTRFEACARFLFANVSGLVAGQNVSTGGLGLALVAVDMRIAVRPEGSVLPECPFIAGLLRECFPFRA
jgi:hypothetical protein